MIEREFEGGRFPDKRLARRLTKIAVKTAQDPRASFPQIARSDSELEAIYRFLSNSRVRMEAILEPHQDATLARMARHDRVAVVHDSTQFAFRNDVGERFGYLPGPGQRGIVGHFALAVDDGGIPLGVLTRRSTPIGAAAAPANIAMYPHNYVLAAPQSLIAREARRTFTPDLTPATLKARITLTLHAS